MIEIRVEAQHLQALARFPERLRWALDRLLGREAQIAARDMKAEMADRRIAATSLLINSVAADAIGSLTWRVAPHVHYARYVLDGRRPGGRMPPWRHILDWMKAKRIGADPATAWAIARAIRRRGIKGRDYLTPVAERAAERLQAAVPGAVDEALGRVG